MRESSEACLQRREGGYNLSSCTKASLIESIQLSIFKFLITSSVIHPGMKAEKRERLTFLAKKECIGKT